VVGAGGDSSGAAGESHHPGKKFPPREAAHHPPHIRLPRSAPAKQPIEKHMKRIRKLSDICCGAAAFLL